MPKGERILAPDPVVGMLADDASMFVAAAQPTQTENLEQVAKKRIQYVIQGYKEDGNKLTPDQEKQIREQALLAL